MSLNDPLADAVANSPGPIVQMAEAAGYNVRPRGDVLGADFHPINPPPPTIDEISSRVVAAVSDAARTEIKKIYPVAGDDLRRTSRQWGRELESMRFSLHSLREQIIKANQAGGPTYPDLYRNSGFLDQVCTKLRTLEKWLGGDGVER